MNQDCYVSIEDIAQLSAYWLADWCTGPDWCQGTEFPPHDGVVNLKELTKIVENWFYPRDERQN